MFVIEKEAGLPGPKKLKGQKPVISSFKKAIIKYEKRSDFLQNFVKITTFNVQISYNIASFSQIPPKPTYFLYNIQI